VFGTSPACDGQRGVSGVMARQRGMPAPSTVACASTCGARGASSDRVLLAPDCRRCRGWACARVSVHVKTICQERSGCGPGDCTCRTGRNTACEYMRIRVCQTPTRSYPNPDLAVTLRTFGIADICRPRVHPMSNSELSTCIVYLRVPIPQAPCGVLRCLGRIAHHRAQCNAHTFSHYAHHPGVGGTAWQRCVLDLARRCAASSTSRCVVSPTCPRFGLAGRHSSSPNS